MIDRVAVLFLGGSALFGAVLLGELNPEDPAVPPADGTVGSDSPI